jgi:hypothetical protein
MVVFFQLLSDTGESLEVFGSAVCRILLANVSRFYPVQNSSCVRLSHES